ncbi:MAG: hypothetical protein EPN97_16155 [Alphaproteobacteria bacterium]|nr:MAG: hypothetical protein EPN97_16155 [Alphaproteobacteria bacterium]
MRWIGISGTWRTTNGDVERDVRASVRAILAEGNGIIAGGATGVDYFATDEALKLASDGTRIQVVLPSTMENYIAHLQAWADGYDTGDPSVQRGAIDRLVDQLNGLRKINPASVIEGPAVPALDICQKDYDARNTVVAAMSDEIVAFQVNKSTGTQDTIDKAQQAGKKATVFSYSVAQDKTYGKLKPKF